MGGRHVEVPPELLGHSHVVVQFRDGKEPHCRTCGLTADGRTPTRHSLRGGPGTGRGPAADPGSQPPRGASGVSRTVTEFERFGTRVHGVAE